MGEDPDGVSASRVGQLERLELRHPFLINAVVGVVLGVLWWLLIGWPSGLAWLIGWPVVRGGRMWYRGRHLRRG